MFACCAPEQQSDGHESKSWCLCPLLYHALSQCEHIGVYILVWWKKIFKNISEKDKYMFERKNAISDPLQC